MRVNKLRDQRYLPPDRYRGLDPLEKLLAQIQRVNETFGNGVNYHYFPTYRSKDPCYLCGEPSGEWEHIDAWSKGGRPWTSSNQTRACRRCNEEKGTMALLEYLIWLRKGKPQKERRDVREKRLRTLCRLLYWRMAALRKTCLLGP